MNSFPVPFRIVATVLLSGILLTTGVWNFRDRSLWTVPADGALWSLHGETLKADTIRPGSAAESAGIRPGDALLSIDGHRIENIGDYSDLIYLIGSGAEATYAIQGESGVRDVSVRLEAAHVLKPRDGLRAMLALLHLGIGFFVLFRAKRLAQTYHFFFICLAAFVVYLYSWTTRLSPFDWWVYFLSILAFLILPVLFLHFCLRFPVSSPGLTHPWVLYTPACLLILLQGFWITGNLASLGIPRTPYWSGVIDNIHLGYFVAGLLAGGIILLRNRFRTLDLTARQQMKWVGYGTLFGTVPFVLIYVIPFLLGIPANFAMESSMLFLAFIPLSIGYAVVRFRLMDVENIARRSVAYFTASSLLLVVYLLFVLLFGSTVQWIVPQANFMVICLAVLLVALLFAPLRSRIQLWLDRRFYRERFEDRSGLIEFAHKLSSEMNLEALSKSLADRVARTFRIERVAIFLADPAYRGFFRLTFSRDPSLSSSPAVYREDELLQPAEENSAPEADRAARGLQTATPTLQQQGFFQVLDLKLHGRRVGLIALGRIADGGHFTTEDMDLLATLAGYATMALENANLYRSVENKAIELERLKQYTENIIESINVAVIAINASGRVTSCNRAFEGLFETARRSIIGARIEDLLPGDVLTSIHRLSGTESWNIPTSGNMVKLFLENKRGKRLFVNLSFIPLHYDAEMTSGTLIVLDDITEKAELEKQLVQSEKLSSIGLLAAGIAHEINTPIAGISSYTQMLLKGLPESDKNKAILQKIENQTFRAAEIVNGLLNFSRMSGSEFNELDVNQLINESLTLLSHHFRGNHIKVESRFDPSLPTVYGNSGKLQQVFINLLLNARDAMPSGGNLSIETGMNESMVVIDIADTGVGISEEDCRKIFDPFFTTKSMGKGTGLGLSVSYGIIQEHGGRILVDSDLGKGTHFKLKLPTRLQ